MRVLLVDDHEVIRRSVRTLLESYCDVCGEAVDGNDAVEKARQLKPDRRCDGHQHAQS
jgi:two-component system, chemotaxis family, chemotaxis protein CheY